MPKTLKRFLFVPLVAVATCAVLTACGGDDPADTSTSSDETADAQPSDESSGDAGSDDGSAGSEDGSGDRIELSVDVCTLGADEITALLDPTDTGEVSSAEEEAGSLSTTFGPSCNWTGPFGEELSVTVSKYDDWVSLDDLPSNDSGLSEPPQEVPGLGDEAWASLGGAAGQQVAWRRDDISVHVSGNVSFPEDSLLGVAESVDAALQSSDT